MNLLEHLWSWLWDGYGPTAEPHEDLCVKAGDARHRYTPLRLLAVGDLADIHIANFDDADAATEQHCLLKVSRRPEERSHLDIEWQTLSRLANAAGHSTYRNYLPDLLESFPATGPLPVRVNVFRFQPGFYTLEQVHEHHPALDGRHLAWIFKRMLTVLGFIHRQKRIHGAILPCHALIHAAGHGLQLVGWGQNVAVGQRLGTLVPPYRAWYPAEVQKQRPVGPATDLFLAARCLVYLAGGDPVTNWMPETVPLPMQRFLGTCLLESAGMRPDDAWPLQEEFDALLQALYGPPRFHELTLP